MDREVMDTSDKSSPDIVTNGGEFTVDVFYCLFIQVLYCTSEIGLYRGMLV